MPEIIAQKLSELLQQTKEAHQQFEKVELEGQFDEQWATWYADNLVTSGLSGLLGKEVDVDELASLINDISQWHEAEQTAEPWADYAARELLQSLT